MVLHAIILNLKEELGKVVPSLHILLSYPNEVLANNIKNYIAIKGNIIDNTEIKICLLADDITLILQDL